MNKNNPVLDWIKRNESLLSINALEQFIGVPHLSLRQYLKEGRSFPDKHLPKLAKLVPVIFSSSTAIRKYVEEQLWIFRKRELFIQSAWESQDKVEIIRDLRGGNQQLLEGIVMLWIEIHVTDAALSEFFYEKLNTVWPGAEGFKQSLLNGQHFRLQPMDLKNYHVLQTDDNYYFGLYTDQIVMQDAAQSEPLPAGNK